ncbi:17.4 kDa class iii heat shock protein, partial [Phtheirospermum japonicum]
KALSELLNFPDTIKKFVLSSPRPNDADHRRCGSRSAASFPVDILDTPAEYVFYMDALGLSKSDTQVTVEEENTTVIKRNWKRKGEDGEGEEGCKYVRLDRRSIQKQKRKSKLSENANVSAITTNCENGVLTVVVKKLPPPPKPKTVEVAIS